MDFSSDPMSSFLFTSGGVALLSALIIQHLKNADWFPFLGTRPEFAKANLTVSMVVAFLTSAGVSYHFDSSAGMLDLHLSLHQLWHFGVQWLEQHFAYKTTIVPTELLAAAVKQLKILNSSKTEIDNSVNK
jgi:hypothetical protein